MQCKYEIVKNQEGLPIRISIYRANINETHWHDAIEIILVLKGLIHVRIGSDRYLLKENDFVLINSNELHSVSKETDDNMILVLLIKMDFYFAFYPQIKNIYFQCNSVESNDKESEKFEQVKKYIAKIAWEMNQKQKGFQLKVGIETNLLLLYLLEHFEYELLDEKSLQIMNKDIQKLKDIIDYINLNMEGSVTLQDIGNNMNLSTYYISHFFKENMGISFQDYLQNLRVDKATDLLLYTDKRITEIAYNSGFSDIKSMNHNFRKAYGCTPTEFRQKNETLASIVNQDISIAGKGMICKDEESNAAMSLLFQRFELV